MDGKKIGWEFVAWIRLANDMAPVNTAVLLGFLNWHKFSELSKDYGLPLIVCFFSAHELTQTANRNSNSQKLHHIGTISTQQIVKFQTEKRLSYSTGSWQCFFFNFHIYFLGNFFIFRSDER
jgi:hypothetical protein